MNLINLINVLKLQNNNELDETSDSINNKIYYRVCRYLNFCLATMTDDSKFNISESSKILQEFLSYNGPCVCEVFTDPDEFHEPKVVASLDSNGKFIPGELKNIKWIE